MQIQYNTDKTINGDVRNNDFFTSFIAEELSRFEIHITRIEVYVSDENGEKEGPDDKQCKMEARLKGRKPILVSSNGDTVRKAVSGATSKLKSALEKIIGKIQNH